MRETKLTLAALHSFIAWLSIERAKTFENVRDSPDCVCVRLLGRLCLRARTYSARKRCVGAPVFVQITLLGPACSEARA